MRRAKLPLAYSQGYNPRPRLTLALALPLGYTSECEIAEFWMKQDQALKDVAAALAKTIPQGVVVNKLEEIPLKAPKPQVLIQSAEYIITLLESVPDLTQRIEDLLATESLPIQRKRKGKLRNVDLCPLIYNIEILSENKTGQQRMLVHLAAREGATGRADEVLKSIDLNPHLTRIHRTQLHIQDGKITDIKGV